MNMHVMYQKNTQRDQFRAIRCPVCPVRPGGRIIDLAVNMDISRVVLYAPQESYKAQFISKCPKCRASVGISIRVS